DTAGVEAILLDLEPPVAGTRGRGRVVDLLEVRSRGTLVAAVHDVVGGAARGGEHVAPHGGHGVAGLDVDDEVRGRGRVGRAVAGDGVRGDVLDGAVVGRDADTVADAVVRAVDLDGGEDGV